MSDGVNQLIIGQHINQQMFRKNQQQELKENNKSLLRNLIADKTIRHHQQLQKIAQPTSPNTQDPTIKQFQINILENSDSLKNNQHKINIKSNHEHPLKQQLQLLEKQLSNLKSENTTLRNQLTSIHTSLDTSSQTITIAHEVGVMTALGYQDMEELENTLEMSTHHTNNLIKELQCSYSNNEELNLKIQQLNQQLEIVSNQLYKRNQQIEIAELELEQLRKGLLNIKTPVDSQTNTTLNLQHLETIIHSNQQLKAQNQSFIQYKLQLQSLYHSITENTDDYQLELPINNDSIDNIQSLMDKIQYFTKTQIEKNTKPLEEEIQLLKQLFETQRRKYQDKEVTLHKLLADAHQTIQELMNQLRYSKKQAKDQFLNNLIKQRTLNGVKAIYDITSQ